uniref:Uncharacterized protein n=1 Tax=Amphimedon queenslandica TaxID=400682 RepID=A0A1X7UPY9_AMPQE
MSIKCLLPSKTLGRPPILGFKLDHLLQERIKSMRLWRTPIGTSIVISNGTAIAKKHTYSCEAPTLRKEWTKSVLRRIGFSKRRANSKSKVQPHDFLELNENFLFHINGVVEMEDIPSSLIINLDQTAVQVVPSCSWTMEKKGTKRIERLVLMTNVR